MVERAINKEILNSINEFIKEIKKHYNITTIILFGSYAKGTENEDSDIDIAVISDDFEDIYECMANLMGMTWDIDARIEPHPIKKKDFDYYDKIIAMDSYNIRNLKRFCDSEKIVKLLAKDVADPWYTNDFETCYNDIQKGLLILLKEYEDAKRIED